ncbi:MAG: transglutaminase domain-containing protein [Chlorobi bacterium]|nr:transglutaminase domain-containing protein [Chlorobiota bacterium]
MNKPFYFLAFFLFPAITITAQRIEQDLAKANQLKAEYPEEHVACLLSESVFDFKLETSKEGDKIEVLQKTDQDFISLLDYTNFVTYIFYDKNSEITRLDVRGKNNRKTAITSVDKEYTGNGIFHSDGRIKIYDLDFSTKGELKRSYYSKTFHDIKYFTSVFLQEEYPVSEKKLVFNIPDWLDLELKEMNFEGCTFEKKIDKTPGKTTTVTYVFKNLDAPADESRSYGPTYTMPHILILAKSYKKNGIEINLFKSADDLYAWYHSLVLKTKSNREVLRPIVTKLTANMETDEEKIKAIYYWVQDNIRYIAFEDGIAGFQPEDADKVCSNRYGDCKGMANLTKQMLLIAGFDARLTWVGTRHIAYSYDIPSLAVDNHMICTLIYKGEKTYLDATEEFIPYGDISERIQGRQVMIEDGDSYILETVPVLPASKNSKITTLDLSLEDGQLSGSLKMEFNGESKMGFQRTYQSLSSSYKSDALKVYLTDDDKNISVSEIETMGINNRDTTLVIKAKIRLDNQVSEFDNDIYISLDKDKEFEHFDIDSTRASDVLFSYKILFQTQVTLSIPEGYKVSYFPENLNVSSDDFSFNLVFSYSGNTLVFSKTIGIPNAIVRKQEFKQWNDMIIDLKKIYDDQVILSKI